MEYTSAVLITAPFLFFGLGFWARGFVATRREDQA